MMTIDRGAHGNSGGILGWSYVWTKRRNIIGLSYNPAQMRLRNAKHDKRKESFSVGRGESCIGMSPAQPSSTASGDRSDCRLQSIEKYCIVTIHDE